MVRFLPVLLLLFLSVGVFVYLPAKRTILYTFGLSNDPTTSCCNEEKVADSDGNFSENDRIAIFDGEQVDYPKTSLAQITPPQLESLQVLGTKNSAGEEKWIEVSLKDQKLRAYEGNNIVMEFPISSGRWFPTPKGDFSIWYKTRYQKMEGGSKELGTYYNLPNVPSNMFFYKGFAIHGAYWHNNFGQPMSHGCVNAPLAQVAQLFEWSGPLVPQNKNAVRASADNPGTRVFVH